MKEQNKISPNIKSAVVKCDLCEKELKVPREYLIHYILDHIGYQDMFVCEECNLGIQDQIWNIIFDEYGKGNSNLKLNKTGGKTNGKK